MHSHRVHFPVQVLVIDHYDSFTWNLVQVLEAAGATCNVVRCDHLAMSVAARAQAIVLSPGPCSPDESGISRDVVTQLMDQVPMLGVCLGHQIIASALGATVGRATRPMHGKTTAVTHDRTDIFEHLDVPFAAARYNSLTVRPPLPEPLVATAWSEGEIMGLRHRREKIFGVQFHPESMLSVGGERLLHSWLKQVVDR